MKINIDIDDNRKYAEVAFLIDREDFLHDIKEVRHKIGLSNIPYIFPDFPYDEANSIVDKFKDGLFTINETRSVLEEFCKEKGILNLYALDKTLGRAVMYAEILIRKYHKNRLYIPVVLASILTGKIHWADFLSTLMFEINQKVCQELIAELEKDEEIMTISINPESTLKELQQVFDFIQKYYFKTRKTEDNDALNNIYENGYSGKLADTIPNIKRDRDWYWLKKESLSYQKIKDHYFETSKKHISIRGIELAIKRYSDNLK